MFQGESFSNNQNNIKNRTLDTIKSESRNQEKQTKGARYQDNRARRGNGRGNDTTPAYWRQIMSSKKLAIVYLTCARGTLRSLAKAQFMIRRNTSFSQHRCAFASNLRRRLHISHVLRLESKMATEVKSEEGRDTRGCRPRFVRNQSLISTRFARPRRGADIPGKRCEAGSGPSTTGIDSTYTIVV